MLRTHSVGVRLSLGLTLTRVLRESVMYLNLCFVSDV